MKEIWKDIPGYEGLYQASNTGKIKSYDRVIVIPPNSKSVYGFNYVRKGRQLKQQVANSGYLKVLLYDENGNRKYTLVHRLIASTFIPNPNKYKCINHRDENKLNNSLDNLEWCTHKYNTNYGSCISRRSEKQKITNSRITPVAKCDDFGNIVDVYTSMREAARSNKLYQSNIFKSCNSNIKSGGYLWRYVKV